MATSNGDAGYDISMECERKVDPTVMTESDKDMWSKKDATALVKDQWAENLSKCSGVALTGGVTLDVERMKTEAQEEITRLEEESRLNHQMMPIDLMG